METVKDTMLKSIKKTDKYGHSIYYEVYFYCDYAFPDFPNEAYIEMLKGEEGEIIRIGEVNENGEVVLYK